MHVYNSVNSRMAMLSAPSSPNPKPVLQNWLLLDFMLCKVSVPSPTLHPLQGMSAMGDHILAPVPALPGEDTGEHKPCGRSAACLSAGLTLGAQCTMSSLCLVSCCLYVPCVWRGSFLPTVLNKLKSHKGASYWRLPLTPPRSTPVPPTGSPQNTCEGLTCPLSSLVPSALHHEDNWHFRTSGGVPGDGPGWLSWLRSDGGTRLYPGCRQGSGALCGLDLSEVSSPACNWVSP